jgi:histidinol-phosphate phosphatase family protein
MAEMSWGVFLDRDGVIISQVLEGITDPSEVKILIGAAWGIKKLNLKRIPAVVISNQSGVGTGLITYNCLSAINVRMIYLLAKETQAKLDGEYYCLHKPADGCTCRKPGIGNFLKASEQLGLDLSRSYYVGDRETDLEAAREAGCRFVVVTTQPFGIQWARWSSIPDLVATNLSDAVDQILKETIYARAAAE